MQSISEIESSTCAFLTLGCKVNQADTETLRSDLTRAGWQECSPDNGADLYVINTCAVTSVAEAKSRRLIRRIGRLSPKSKIVVTGCYAHTKPQEIAQLPGVELILPPSQENQLAKLLGRPRTYFGGVSYQIKDGLSYQSMCGAHRTRAILKIQDGCASYCSFCILPFIRGRPTSKPLNTAIQEAKDLVQAGHKEMVLTGINLGQYGQDLNPNINLVDVLKRLIKIKELKRIRLSSIGLNGLTDNLLHFMQTNPKVCPHLHISLQSGSDKILKQMNRHYTTREYLDCLDRIRQRLNNPAITTDVMVGFPGETDEDFQLTLKVCRQAGFSKIHSFPFSVRPGTKAAELNSISTLRVKPLLIKQRVKTLEKLANSLALSYKKDFLSQTVEVLLEDKGKSGFTKRYLKVQVTDGQQNLVNQLVKVEVTGAVPERLTGRLVL